MTTIRCLCEQCRGAVVFLDFDAYYDAHVGGQHAFATQGDDDEVAAEDER